MTTQHRYIRRGLLEAAKDIHYQRAEFSCIAVGRVLNYGISDIYAAIAAPRPGNRLAITDITRSGNNGRRISDQEAKDFRVLLILMIREAYNDLVD